MTSSAKIQQTQLPPEASNSVVFFYAVLLIFFNAISKKAILGAMRHWASPPVLEGGMAGK